MAELPIVVVADPIDRTALERLRAGPCRVRDASADPASLRAHLADAWGLVVRSRTKVTADLLGAAPRLALVARAGVGVDNIDMSAAGARGIRVVNAPAAATASVAELTVALYLLLLRGLYPAIAATKGGRWERGGHGRELAGKTVGFVGYGRIAREVARRIGAFGASAIAFDPFVATAPDRTEMLALDALLARADVVSLHAALTDSNRHLIDAAALAKMRPGSYLVNVARGPLVDERALLAALREGRLAGAALDVFEVEPPTDRELLERPDVIATPHLGAMTTEGQARAGAEIVDEVLRAARGEPLSNLVAMPGGPA
ncbi:MAG TPA: NAD(P)-dependent oxidoreductase [Thermoplasmata archaeon]|nr:NAD(P)-dependent oxidoreductase [Thermoplasmata archaeon]